MELKPSAHVDTFARDHLPPAGQWPDLRFDLAGADGPRYPDRLNCGAELLDATVTRLGGGRPAVHDGAGGLWSYGELQRHVDRMARTLAEDLGVVPGNRVLLRGPTTPWLAACWLAVMKAGAVAVTVLAAQRPQELATVCELARVRHALCDARSLDDLVNASVPSLRITPYGGNSPADLLRLAADKPPSYAAVDTSADDVALIAFTSGTTGRPKGCVHFHRDVLAVADTFSARVLRPGPDDVFAGSPPLGFTFGLGGLVIFPLRVGAATLLADWSGPEGLLDDIERHRVSVLFTAPTAYRAMLARLGAYDISSLRRCVSAGEHLPAALWHAWQEATGLRVINGIGATEMLHIFISAAGDAIRPGTTGLPVPGYEARVLGPDGGPAADGEPGLLAVRGPTGCRYLADPRQRDYVRDGWNVTGDTYVREPDGYFRYVARADDMIVSAGYNIAGPEVEEALLRHPDVLEAAVVGRPDERRGEIVVAHVVLREGVPRTGETVAALREFTKKEIVPYKCPREIEFTEALPRTPTGKLQRFRLRTGALQFPRD
ncbi:2-aminobenzoate-CoA ligase [Streptomyces eurocidicus]|uniref:2-aminobenzoate-CoA ligase n=1 Tax=Streptomyces eurocidicus TaxID=66423 RepID=A0A2N8NW07_STREU|nr:AMP-binding protein [Streptomyces eurocidicus]MBB5119087.1 2-aminobenzoate-CoA ligase [Streptomyces eurocidicus]MBF6050461.1 AMP-binding protein [Streptomyces eurocidicus]PNE32949.1 2-aminobenzoate-CoA ligase [Streptomyces eurocidicus]